MTDSACNNTTITILNSNVTYKDGSPQTITVTSAGPVGSQGGKLTNNAVPIEIEYGKSHDFIASSSDGSNGNFKIEFKIRCNGATEPGYDAVYETLTVDATGDCSIINSKNCNVGGYATNSDDFMASVTNSSPMGKGENWIKIAVANL